MNKEWNGEVPKVSGLAAWRENCKWYSSLPLDAVVSTIVSQCSEFCRHNPLCCFSTSVYCRCRCLFRYRLSPETFGYTLVHVCKNFTVPTLYIILLA
jgi:hypothetical protein